MLVSEKKFEGLASLSPCNCRGTAIAGIVEPVLGANKLSPDLSCGLLRSPKSPPLGWVGALPPKRFDPEVLVVAPKRLLDGAAAGAAELDSAGFVDPKRALDVG